MERKVIMGVVAGNWAYCPHCRKPFLVFAKGLFHIGMPISPVFEGI